MTDQEINEAVARKIHGKDLRIKLYVEGIIEAVCFKDGKSWTLPNYCHDIKAAWEILEAHKGDWDLCRQNSAFHCELFIQSYQQDAWDRTIPMAICKAFLKLPS